MICKSCNNTGLNPFATEGNPVSKYCICPAGRMRAAREAEEPQEPPKPQPRAAVYIAGGAIVVVEDPEAAKAVYKLSITKEFWQQYVVALNAKNGITVIPVSQIQHINFEGIDGHDGESGK